MRMPLVFLLVFLIFTIFPIVNAVSINNGTVLNTSISNSSVTFSFDINTSNFTVESSSVLLYGINFANSTGMYTCDDVNHSIENSNLDSSEFNCALQSSGSESSNPGSSYYFYEQSKYLTNKVLELKVKMRKNTQKDLNIDNSKETSISKISLTSRDYLSGEIKFSKLNSLPLNCNFPNNLQNNIIYRIIQINSTIEKEDLENVSLFVNIDKLWINQNEITNINGIKCLPSFQNIESSLIQEEKDFSSYKFTSDGFSTWIIFGTKESKTEEIDNTIKENLNETSEAPEENISQIDIYKQEIKDNPLFCFTFLNICWYWWLVSLLLFIIIVSFAIYYNKKRKKKKHKKK